MSYQLFINKYTLAWISASEIKANAISSINTKLPIYLHYNLLRVAYLTNIVYIIIR